MKKLYYLFLFFSFYTVGLSSQELIKKDTLQKKATIKHTINENELLLTPITPPLRQIAGAPKAYYSYFWEFGDGKFSKQKEPKHTYKTKGDYEVKLWVTNHYDVGKPPSTRPEKVSIKKTSKPVKNDEASMNDDLELQINRDPVPEQEMVMVLSYKNPKPYVSNGRVYLFYNEKKYKKDNFTLSDFRTYHNEKLVTENENDGVAYVNNVDDNAKLYASLTNEVYQQELQDSTKTDLEKTLRESKEYYKNWNVFDFDNINPSEERNMFFTFKTTPEMLKDTSAIISVRGVYIPDRTYKNHKVKEKEMEIVTSHDPNKMSSNGTLMNYRLVRFKTLKYKVQFQNDGEGPAKTIRLETDIPDMLDKSTLKVVDMYPKCEICPKKPVQYSCLDTTFTDKQAIFTFKNIYLPGTNQKGVKEKDSTKGFVKYKIKFSKDFHKKKTKSKTAIFFDKNDPIITNTSTTRFLPGISVGVKAGYNEFTKLNKSKSYFVGATVSPFKSYRWYWQAELLTNKHTFSSDRNIVEVKEDTPAQSKIITRTTTEFNYENIDVEIPLLIRYNINNYFGLGAGFQGVISLQENQKKSVLLERIEQHKGRDDKLISTKTNSQNFKNSFVNLRKGLLFEVTGGFARIGPSVGARYVINIDNNYNYWQLYAIWKF